jgi:hypothetical protein
VHQQCSVRADDADTPEVEQRLQDLGVRLVSSERRSPEYLAGFVRDEIEKSLP